MDIRIFIRQLPIYKKTFKNIHLFKNDKLIEHLKDVEKNVPYYKDKNLTGQDYKKIRITRKLDVIGDEDRFINKNKFKFLLRKVSTSGTTGISLNILKSYKDMIKETAYVDYAFSLIGNNLKIAVLRGNKFSTAFEKKNGKLFLSSYSLTNNTIQEYVELIKKCNVNCIHAYPGALLIFLKLIESNNLLSGLDDLKGILTSSEVLSQTDKKYILSILPHIKLIDLYGHNEHVAFAIAEGTKPYTFFKSYGYTELIPSYINHNGNQISEIVSTGFNNDAMPLVRYGTDDFVELDAKGSIISIIGRFYEYLFDFNNEVIPCIVAHRDRTLKNVLSFQFFQEKPGYAEYRMIVNSSFDESDMIEVNKDLKRTFDDKLLVNVIIVSKMELTKAGKLKRLIQKMK